MGGEGVRAALRSEWRQWCVWIAVDPRLALRVFVRLVRGQEVGEGMLDDAETARVDIQRQREAMKAPTQPRTWAPQTHFSLPPLSSGPPREAARVSPRRPRQLPTARRPPPFRRRVLTEHRSGVNRPGCCTRAHAGRGTLYTQEGARLGVRGPQQQRSHAREASIAPTRQPEGTWGVGRLRRHTHHPF
jgi:hypothetical protein